MTIFDAFFGALALGLWGWLALIVMSGIIIWAQEYEVEGPSIASILGFGIILWLLNYGFTIPAFDSVLALVGAMAWKFAVFALVYAGIGGLWAVAKWWFFLHNKADEYGTKREELAKKYVNGMANGADRNFNGEYIGLSATSFKSKYPALKDYLLDAGYPPSPLKNKLRIYSWMMYWPWSALWTLAKDPAKYVWKLVYTNIAQLMSRMSEYVFAGRYEEFN